VKIEICRGRPLCLPGNLKNGSKDPNYGNAPGNVARTFRSVKTKGMNDMKNTTIKGRAWVIKDPQTGKFIDNIDTDMIYHNAHLAVTKVEEMGQYAFGNLGGWNDFPKKAKSGDIIFVGENFGAGSSRQHAVDCFRALGITLIVAGSYGAIYKRNAINSGMPIVTYPKVKEAKIKDGDEVEIDLVSGKIKNLTTGETQPQADPFSRVQLDIYQAGDLFAYARV
jgi:3-isopropylmalate dehydratase small subunit